MQGTRGLAEFVEVADQIRPQRATSDFDHLAIFIVVHVINVFHIYDDPSVRQRVSAHRVLRASHGDSAPTLTCLSEYKLDVFDRSYFEQAMYVGFIELGDIVEGHLPFPHAIGPAVFLVYMIGCGAALPAFTSRLSFKSVCATRANIGEGES